MTMTPAAKTYLRRMLIVMGVEVGQEVAVLVDHRRRVPLSVQQEAKLVKRLMCRDYQTELMAVGFASRELQCHASGGQA